MADEPEKQNQEEGEEEAQMPEETTTPELSEEIQQKAGQGEPEELSSEDEHEALLKEESEAAEEKQGPAEVVPEEEPKGQEEPPAEISEVDERLNRTIFALRTTANREDQVMDFIVSNVEKKGLKVYAVIRPHGMRGYIFLEAENAQEAALAAQGIPYARGILPQPVQYREIEHMLEQVKREVDIRKNDIAEIISGPFKREQCKITRVDKVKEEVVVELLSAAVPIPITVKMDAVKVIRRETEEEEGEEGV